MLKYLFLFISFAVALLANDKVEIYASSITSQNNTVHASGGVTVMYKDYFLTADKASYNKKTGDLELFNNIRANHGGKYKILGKYALLNLAKKERVFKPFYMIDNASEVWMSGAQGSTKCENIDIEEGIVSGCNPIDPLWTMEFSSSDYNANTKWLNLYNARLYIYDIAVFYTPWFGYSLDKTRKTGLLKPSVGISESEGFYYQQPFYIAEQNWWDLEFKPQIRTSRGVGIYSVFRFVDSPISRGYFKTGYFQEQEHYAQEYNLENKKHYGFNFEYDNSDFINQWFGSKFSGQSGLYIDINNMNDVDYINLETSSSSIDTTTSAQVLSRINLFYNTNQHYFGLYTKYYQDLTLPNNDNTLQKLPTLQYHYYLDSLFKDHLLYSFDMKSNNIYRKINKKIVQTDMNIPVALQTSLFDEYLTLSYTANLSMQYSDFISEDEVPLANVEYRDGYHVRNYHTFLLNTQLTKPYESFSHVIDLGIIYNQSAWSSKTGFYSDLSDFCSNEDNKNDPTYEAKCEFYNIRDIENEARIEFRQYIFDENANEVLYHRLAQRVSNSKSSDGAFGELENELDYKVTQHLSYYNNMLYNYKRGKLSKLFNQISFEGKDVSVAFSHLYKDTFLDKTPTYTPYTSYVTSSAEYIYDKHYSFSGVYNYDIENKEKKSVSFGFMYKKRCWDFGVKYSENNRPILTNDGGSSSVYDKFIYITVVLKPFMQPSKSGSLISYRLPDDN